MTRPAQPAQAVSAVMADRYATAAAMAAREATRAAKMAMQPGRSQNVAARFISGAREAAMTGQFEPFKTTTQFDGTAQHPEWMG